MSRCLPLFSLSWRVYVLIIGVCAALCSSLADYAMLRAQDHGDVPAMMEAQKLWPFTRELRERPAYMGNIPLHVVAEALQNDPFAVDLALRFAANQTDPALRQRAIDYARQIWKYRKP